MQNNNNDQQGKNKSWPQKNWYWIAILAYFIGLVSPGLQDSINKKISPKTHKAKKKSQVNPDSVVEKK